MNFLQTLYAATVGNDLIQLYTPHHMKTDHQLRLVFAYEALCFHYLISTPQSAQGLFDAVLMVKLNDCLNRSVQNSKTHQEIDSGLLMNSFDYQALPRVGLLISQ
jgi:hypothetical protein